MKNKKWISLAAAVILAVTALPATVFAAKDGESKEELTKVTLNEVAHSISVSYTHLDVYKRQAPDQAK